MINLKKKTPNPHKKRLFLTKNLSIFLLFLAFFLSFQSQVFSSEKNLGRSYRWCPIPDRWCKEGVHHHCSIEYETNCCWLNSDQACTNCYLRAHSLSSSGKHKKMPKAYREGVSWGSIPHIGWDGNCVVCENYEAKKNIRKPVYSGYIQLTYNKGYPFLKRQIEYTKKYPNYQAYWPETSIKARNINNIACKKLEILFDLSALKKIKNSSKLQQEFPSGSWYFDTLGYCLHISLVSQCFRFTDYSKVTADLLEYCKSHFSKSEYLFIEDKLLDLLDELAPLFMEIYEESMAKHPTPEIAKEIEFLNNKSRIILPYIENSCVKTPRASNFKPSFYEKVDFVEKASSLKAVSVSQGSIWSEAAIHLSKGEVFNDFLLYREAIDALTKAIQCNPKLVEAYIERAHAYFELGDTDKAIADYQKVKKLKKQPKIKGKFIVQGIMTDLHDHNYTFEQLSLMGFFPDHPKDYSGGFCIGVLEGIKESVKTFIPSTLSSISGIGQGLWAFACSPKEVTQEVIDTSYAVIHFIRNHSTEETLQLVVPELRDLCQNWDKLNDNERGRRTGFIIGKYGVDIFGVGVTIKYVKKYRDLKRANSLLTIQTCAKSEAKKVKIIEEVAKKTNLRKNLFKEGKVKIHWDKQNKHIPGSHNFEKGRSKIHISREKLESLLREKAGTGEGVGNLTIGEAGYKERVNFGEIIGECFSKKDSSVLPTSNGIIHYDAKGFVHVVPSNP